MLNLDQRNKRSSDPNQRPHHSKKKRQDSKQSHSKSRRATLIKTKGESSSDVKNPDSKLITEEKGANVKIIAKTDEEKNALI